MKDICNINSITSPICPAGTTANASAGKCIGAMQCPNGGVYDATLNQCVRKTYPNCVSSLTLNKNNDLCETVPSCPPNSGILRFDLESMHAFYCCRLSADVHARYDFRQMRHHPDVFNRQLQPGNQLVPEHRGNARSSRLPARNDPRCSSR